MIKVADSYVGPTEAQHKRMADYYEWILKEYFRLIPPEQQWGICFWCPTDSPASGGWRANTPVGIWTNGTLYRKHVYAGIVRGLGGVDCTDIDEVTTDPASSLEYPAKGIYKINGVRLPANTKYSDLPSGTYIIDGKVVRK